MNARILATAALCLAALACAPSGVRREELPEAPIAILYRDEDQARRRAEAIAGDAPALAPREGVARVEDMSRYLAGLLGTSEGFDQRELVGRMALLDPRSQEVTPIAAAFPGATPLDWSPDHRRLLFMQTVGGGPQLFEYDRVSQEVRPITRGPALHPAGCYGPDGRYVIMTARAVRGRAVTRIALTDPGGRGARPISPGPDDHSPACASDGSAVVWVANTARGRRLVSRMPMDPADGGELRILVPGRDPNFSRDGRWIVYSAPVRDSWKLYRIRPDGSGRAPLGREMLEERQPSFSPDGRFVAYVNEVDFRASLYLRRFDGTGDRILFSDGDATFPAW